MDLDDDELDDPDFVEDVTFWTDSAGDAIWQFRLQLDADKLLDARKRQKAALARYGKQPWTQWSNLDVDDLDEAYDGVVDLVRHENEMSRANEDR